MLDPARPFLISPPFGSWFSHPQAYSVIGSYTVDPRPGSRLAAALRTVRWHRPAVGEAWTNQIGLRNPGLKMVDEEARVVFRRVLANPNNTIISIAVVEGSKQEWIDIGNFIREQQAKVSRLLKFEINVSCPNTAHAPPTLPEDKLLEILIHINHDVIFKLQPLNGSVAMALRLTGAGARYLHLSNTLPSPVGGISGTPLRIVNLGLVADIRDALSASGHKGIGLIGGGGIYAPEHIKAYQGVGVSRFSMATAWAWPPRARGIIRDWAKL